jgi:hypothetical protein
MLVGAGRVTCGARAQAEVKRRAVEGHMGPENRLSNLQLPGSALRAEGHLHKVV